MNPSLSKNIAEVQSAKRNSGDIQVPTKGDLLLVKGLVERIARFKLGRKLDKHGDRTGSFDCKNQRRTSSEAKPIR
jgi:hypothetical protein